MIDTDKLREAIANVINDMVANEPSLVNNWPTIPTSTLRYFIEDLREELK